MKKISAFTKIQITPKKEKKTRKSQNTPVTNIKVSAKKTITPGSSITNLNDSDIQIKKPKRKLFSGNNNNNVGKLKKTTRKMKEITPNTSGYTTDSSLNSGDFLQVNGAPNYVPPTNLCITDKPPCGSSKSAFSSNSAMISIKKNNKKLATPSKMSDTAMENSVEAGRKMFEEVISPVDVKQFFKDIWEQKPMLVRRHKSDYNSAWFSVEELKRILREHNLHYGENIDVVTYTNGLRETHNPQGRVYPSVLWDYYNNGCSIRMLNPHSYCDETWRRLSCLQEFVGSMAGANIYLTPPGTQGFAPHWDDIEAFILQLEGKKHWKVYHNRNESEKLPSYSSENFTEADLQEPVLDVILEAGDLLYFPRGFIHQGKSLPDEHSLHITFSCAQKNSWGQLLEQIIPAALDKAFKEDVDFRRSLPIEYMNYMGIVHEDTMVKKSAKRNEFIKTVQGLVSKLIDHLPVDISADQKVKSYIHDCLPPCINECERQRTINSDVQLNQQLELHTKLKLLRKNMIRLVLENNELFIYHSAENSRIYHQRPLQYIEIDKDLGIAVEFLIKSYPNYISIDQLPCDNNELKMALANIMFENGLLMTSEAFSWDKSIKKKKILTSTPSSSYLRIEKSTSF